MTTPTPGQVGGGDSGEHAGFYFEEYDEDHYSQEVDSDMHAAAEGNGEYVGIHEGDQDVVIEALLALSAADQV